ncbi:anthranilate phosphoribosyltransferase [Sphingomonas piscis]|uniref:Anthranilate phosphoribosyltransferase n=1 Tax=Sphingomonas piscis TaxID=2714943 RepID=A0A6G7YNN5_9SPHN|nr:anthranilate phosphoribosyltransferase [Sphingomonas piscis]QIK78349.1 anthranilate phosphoribosyltransferase [Sphingomonas piscis]
MLVFPSEDRSDVASQALSALFEGCDASREQSRALFDRLVAGELPEPLMAAAFVSLKLKGETAKELTGAVEALRFATRPFPRPEGLFADSCGTGGDGSGSINVSTAAGLVAASCGLPIVKHGNRSVTSKCGSADVLEALGARLDVSPEKSRTIHDETSFCFLLAPLYHPGIAHAGAVRRQLKVRTIMNLLGPCLNPARPPVQLLGVAEPKLMRPIAETLLALGVERGLVVHGSGLDEIAPHAETQAIRIANGALEFVALTPEDAGFERRPLDQIAGGCPEDNARRLSDLLHGRGLKADAQVVALNAGALLWVAGKADSFRAGAEQALDAMAGGKAGATLDRFVEASRG